MRIATGIAGLMTLSLVLACSPQGGGDRPAAEAASDPLPSWNDGQAKQQILDFVARVTDETSPAFVPEEDRIATFDNDGNLWAEKPVYFQLLFGLDRVRALAPEHPEWRTQQPFQAVIENDQATMATFGMPELMKLMAAAHTGITTEEFAAVARSWLDTARHPRFDQPFPSLVYQPQVELLYYLRANGFKTFIVSGGGIGFLRTFAQDAYGIPPWQVVGSSTKTAFELRDGVPVLVKLPEIGSIDDKEGKPVNINLHIGRRPILASGNSDGDLAMFQYTAAGDGPRLILLLHHDDAEREWAYDRDSHVGRLDKALDEANERGWTVVSIKNDFKTVFGFQ